MKKIRLLEMKDIICIVVLVILKTLTILFVFALAIQHFVVDILTHFTAYKKIHSNLELQVVLFL